MAEEPTDGNAEASGQEDRALLERSVRVRQLLGVAEEEARRFGHNYVGQEHLLLALAQDSAGNAGTLLMALGVDPEKVRTAILYIIGRGTGVQITDAIGLTPRAKMALTLAAAEARRRGQPLISTDNLLLGIVEEGGGVGAGVLSSLGVGTARIRERSATLRPDGDREASLNAETVRDAASKGNVLTCRITDQNLQVIDALVDAGIRSSRSDAAAWLIQAGINANRPLIDRVAAALTEIRRLRMEAMLPDDSDPGSEGSEEERA